MGRWVLGPMPSCAGVCAPHREHRKGPSGLTYLHPNSQVCKVEGQGWETRRLALARSPSSPLRASASISFQCPQFLGVWEPLVAGALGHLGLTLPG